MKHFLYDMTNIIFVILILPFLIIGTIALLAALMVISPFYIIVELVKYVVQEHREYTTQCQVSAINSSINISDDIGTTNE